MGQKESATQERGDIIHPISLLYEDPLINLALLRHKDTLLLSSQTRLSETDPARVLGSEKAKEGPSKGKQKQRIEKELLNKDAKR